MNATIRVLLADDDIIVREGLAGPVSYTHLTLPTN